MTGEGKELRCCLPHWAPSLSIYLLCRVTGRRTTKKDRTEGSSSLMHYREKKIEGVKDEIGKGDERVMRE